MTHPFLEEISMQLTSLIKPTVSISQKPITVSNWYNPTIILQFFQLTPNNFPKSTTKKHKTIACQVSLCFCSVISLAFSLDTPCGTCLLSAASNALARASEFPTAPLGIPSEVPPRRCPVGPVPQSWPSSELVGKTRQTGVFFISEKYTEQRKLTENMWGQHTHTHTLLHIKVHCGNENCQIWISIESLYMDSVASSNRPLLIIVLLYVFYIKHILKTNLVQWKHTGIHGNSSKHPQASRSWWFLPWSHRACFNRCGSSTSRALPQHSMAQVRRSGQGDEVSTSEAAVEQITPHRNGFN